MNLTWTVEYDREVLRTLRKIDRPVARRIVAYLDDVAARDDPRTRGKPLSGPLAGLWRYRVGDYRIICDLHPSELVIVAVEVGHRSTIYE